MHESDNAGALGAAYATRTVTKAPNWHALVAWDMLFNNLASGPLLVAGMGELAAPHVFQPIAMVVYPIALVFLLADLVLLIVDLGDPLRFHHMLRVFKPSSPMSLGTWCLTIYSLPLTVLAALSFVGGDGEIVTWVRVLAVLVSVFPALGVAAYKGVLFSTSSQPGWQQARWLGGYLATSAFLLGGVVVLAVAIIMGQGRAVEILRIATILVLLLNAASVVLVALDVRPLFSDPRIGKTLGRHTVLALGVGLVLPLALFLVGTHVLMMVGVLMVLADAMGIRLEIVSLPHALSHTPDPRPTRPAAPGR